MQSNPEKIRMSFVFSPSAIATIDKFVETFLNKAPGFAEITPSIELNKYLEPLLNICNGKELDFSLGRAEGMAEISLVLPNVGGAESFLTIPTNADEFILTKLSEGKPIVQIYFWQKNNPTDTNTNIQESSVALGVIPPQMAKETSAIWHRLYGENFPWNELTNFSKMNFAISEKKLLLMGAFDNNGSLVGAVGALVRKNPTYIEIPPLAINSGSGWWRDIVDEILGKIRFLRPEIILWYVPGNPPYVPTKLGRMLPFGLFWHSGLSQVHQVMAFPLDDNQYEIFAPQDLIPPLVHIIKSFNLPWSVRPADKAMGNRNLEYVLKVNSKVKSANLRIISYGELRLTAKAITDILRSVVSVGAENIYIDLSLAHPAGVPFVSQFIAKKFKPLMLLPGGFLRLGMFINKNTPKIELSMVPPVLLPFAEHLCQ